VKDVTRLSAIAIVRDACPAFAAVEDALVQWWSQRAGIDVTQEYGEWFADTVPRGRRFSISQMAQVAYMAGAQHGGK
jgi:hypothetical protein